ncbi:MAG: 16S rRNA (adenine(1518)-N(6)/adenine(1519)-N(6))-dimethyltransferase RsmA [Polyangiaceae bacterium]
MSDDASPPRARSSAKQRLLERGLRPRKSLGQNFLADEGLAARIAELTAFDVPAHVLEIGAGLGALTAPLLERGQRVTAIETDRQLVPLLRERFEAELASSQLQVIEGDARELDYAGLLTPLSPPRVLAGNLPYHLSGLLLRHAVDHSPRIERCVFLLQLEVVDRLCAAPGSDDYGALSVFAQAVYEPRRSFVIKRGAFYPQPGVDSAVVVLEPNAAAHEPLSERFSELVRRAFGQRRKTLRNAWHGVASELEERAARAGIDLGARGETLGVAEFRRMAAELER